MIRSTMRHLPSQKQPICKVYFTKIKKNVFFLFAIRLYSQKYISLHRVSKNATKLLKKINTIKLNYKIMKTFYQIVVKGIATNKISVYETDDYRMYKKALKAFNDEFRIIVLTTNIYTGD